MVRKTALDSVEPTKMSLPAMDRVSVTFALMLDSFRIGRMWDEQGNPLNGDETSYLLCSECDEALCTIDDGDTMRVLFNTALAHSC